MATFAIGDIHGCFTALETLIQVVAPSPEDQIVFLGDYVDRGPNSAHVIEYLRLLDPENAICLRGNHEIMMMAFRDQQPDSKSWLDYGGAETLISYGIETLSEDWLSEIPDEHWSFLENTLPYYEVEGFVIVHAGLEPGVPLPLQTSQALFWNKMINPKPYADDVRVICGHTAQTNGMIANLGHTICIDTCAYGDQWLTCLELEWGTFWQANQKGEARQGRISYQESEPVDGGKQF